MVVHPRLAAVPLRAVLRALQLQARRRRETVASPHALGLGLLGGGGPPRPHRRLLLFHGHDVLPQVEQKQLLKYLSELQNCQEKV